MVDDGKAGMTLEGISASGEEDIASLMSGDDPA